MEIRASILPSARTSPCCARQVRRFAAEEIAPRAKQLTPTTCYSRPVEEIRRPRPARHDGGRIRRLEQILANIIAGDLARRPRLASPTVRANLCVNQIRPTATTRSRQVHRS